MDWTQKTVLVTGAGGFIGSHVVERLVGRGARTRALVEYNSDNAWGWLDQSTVREQVDVFLGDVRDGGSLARPMKGADVVLHLAALIAIPHSYEAPLSYVRTNVEGTLNVLEAARSADVGLFVHVSTSEVYGTARYVPIDENHPLQGQSPYSASKIGADMMAEAYHRSFGLPVVTARPFNTYGPRQSARAIIPTIITQALTQNEIRLGNTTPTRDFNYVTDTAEALVRIVESSSAVGETLNIGSGQEISIGELAEKIVHLTGTKATIMPDDDRRRPDDSEVGRLRADSAKMRQITGWAPEVSLEEGLGKTIEWFREHIRDYKASAYVT